MLRVPARDLQKSERWKDLTSAVRASSAVVQLSTLPPDASPHVISSLLANALQEVVQGAGGWESRAAERRPAFESACVRRARATVEVLGRCSFLLFGEHGVGSFSHALLAHIERMRKRGLRPPSSSRSALADWVSVELASARRKLQEALQDMRAERIKRWKDLIPKLWHERPSVIYRWLEGDSPAWGSLPILTASGMQCTTVEEVDASVQDYWVQKIWRMHADKDEGERWAAFESSAFFLHLPRCDFPCAEWTKERVVEVLRHFRDGTSPGVRGIPVGVWKSLPEPFFQAVADLLGRVETVGEWPDELVKAYVAMIPKASGGTRPQDQRPITVLDVVYRIWAKGIVLTWAPILHGTYLGSAAMGFRAQSGTLHLAQLLQDVIFLQQRRGQELWLVSFDLEKCFPSLPWWGLFGVLARVGVDARIVTCLRNFYRQLRHRFRYGQVDGSEWFMANGLAQGCPASPDLMNILFEPFHRWAAAQSKGVSVVNTVVASVSFAADVTLVATSLEELRFLVAGYYEWCALLGVRLNATKTQLWCNRGAVGRQVRLKFGTETVALATRATFRVVGIELGANERAATDAQFSSRLQKALLTGKRLFGLDVPAAVAAHMWRTTVLAQGLYGCEIRNVTHNQLRPLCVQGKALVARKAPLELANFCAAEAVCGPPLGACAARDPRLEVAARRMRWLNMISNQVGLVGTVHRQLASPSGTTWMEPSPALASTLSEFGWTVVRNVVSMRATRWPELDPEPAYSGQVILTPRDGLPPSDAVWTDGSIKTKGGAAALQRDRQLQHLCTLSTPHSSTQCELVALSLVARFQPPPSLVLTDSLNSLQLISSWEQRSSARILACAERVEVRLFLDTWQHSSAPPTLEKVKAHDEQGRSAGNQKSWGNEQVDGLAKLAADGVDDEYSPNPRHTDAVQVHDAAGRWLKDVSAAVTRGWWEQHRTAGATRRSWLLQLYPAGVDFDWRISNYLFRLPCVEGGEFVHAAPRRVLKWTARVRTGALATNARLTGTALKSSSQCGCCPAPVEDDAHAIAGCPGTGSAECSDFAFQLWVKVGSKRGVTMIPLPASWLQLHLLQVAVGLIPCSLKAFVPTGEQWLVPVLLKDFHLGMVDRLAEVLRRRETLMGATAASRAPTTAPPKPTAAVDAVRQLTVAELRVAERQPAAPAQPMPVTPRNQVAREKRKAVLELPKWIKEHKFLRAVPVEQGEPSVALLMLWETDHGKSYPSRAVELVGRVSTFTAAVHDAVGVDNELSRWLTSTRMRMQLSGGLPYMSVQRWSVKIDPAVGEPFLGKWKAYLQELVRQHQSVASSADPGPPRKRLKRAVQPRPRKREREGGAPAPPLHTKKARIERLQAAQAAASEQSSSSAHVPSMVAEQSSSSVFLSQGGAPVPAGVASHAGHVLPGVIT